MSRAYLPSDDLTPAREHSYGIIPLRLNPGTPISAIATSQNTELLLINQRSSLRSQPTFWTFPKGHAERHDKSKVASAVRELHEETGLRLSAAKVLYRSRDESTGAEVLSERVPEEGEKAGAWVERYINPVRKWIKEVRYWVGVVEYSDRVIVVQQREVAGAKWCTWEEAEALLTFEEGKEMLREVKSTLDASLGRREGRAGEKL